MSSKSAKGIGPQRPIRAKGLTGIVTFDGTNISISRKGLSNFNSGRGQAEATWPIEAITWIDWKDPTFWTNGFIWFVLTDEVKKQMPVMMRMTAASGRDNAVVFKKPQLDGFKQIRGAVEAAIRAR